MRVSSVRLTRITVVSCLSALVFVVVVVVVNVNLSGFVELSKLMSRRGPVAKTKMYGLTS